MNMNRALPILWILASCTIADTSSDSLDLMPPDVPESWRPIIGEYASGPDTVSVLERRKSGAAILVWSAAPTLSFKQWRF